MPRVLTVREMMMRMKVGGSRNVRSEKEGQSSSQLGIKTPNTSADFTTSFGVHTEVGNGKLPGNFSIMGGYIWRSDPISSILNSKSREANITEQNKPTEEDKPTRSPRGDHKLE